MTDVIDPAVCEWFTCSQNHIPGTVDEAVALVRSGRCDAHESKDEARIHQTGTFNVRLRREGQRLVIDEAQWDSM